jgi:predicted RNA binding protein YcfA (HicA-like mRNA interferase family)
MVRRAPHIVKLPRDLCANEVVRALRRKGFTVERQQGSHIRLSSGRLRVTVPNHSSIDPKTLQSILRQSKITIQELKDDL